MSNLADESFAEGGDARPGAPIDVVRLKRMLLRSWRWVVVLMAIGAVIGVAMAKLRPNKTYEAETVLGYAGTDYGEREVQSMVESITFTQTLTELQKRLNIGGAPNELQGRIGVAFDPRFSNLIYLRTQGATAKDAKTFADTLAAIFIELQAQRDRARRDEVARKLQMDLEVAQARLSYAQEVYDAFRNRYGVMNLSEETTAALQQAIALRSQAEAAQQSMKAAEVTAQDLRSRLEKAPSADPSPTPATPAEARTGKAPKDDVPLESQEQLDATRRALAAAQVRLSPDHPEIKLLQAKVRDLERRVVGPGTPTTPQGLSSRLAQVQKAQADAQGQYRSLSSAAAEAESRLKQLAQGEGEVAPLLADLGVAENRMRDIKSRLNQALDEARNTVPPFHIVALAVEPTVPIESRAKMVAIAGPIIALLIALIAVLARGLRGLKVYTPMEVAYWGNGPVVGATTWPRDPSMLASLFRELDDCTPYASGLTLIVGAHESETALARGVAVLWPSERQAVSVAEPGRGITVVDQDLEHRQSDETPEKVVIGHVGGMGQPGAPARGAHIVPLQTARANLMRAESGELGPSSPASDSDREVINIAQSWNGALSGPELRRASRLADRVLVVVRSGQRSLFELSAIRTRLGREDGIGYLVVDLDPVYAGVKDRVGDTNDFWRASRDAVR